MLSSSVKACRLRFDGRVCRGIVLRMAFSASCRVRFPDASRCPFPSCSVFLFLQTLVLLLASITMHGLILSLDLVGIDHAIDVRASFPKFFLANITLLHTYMSGAIGLFCLFKGLFHLALASLYAYTHRSSVQYYTQSTTEQALPKHRGQARSDLSEASEATSPYELEVQIPPPGRLRGLHAGRYRRMCCAI